MIQQWTAKTCLSCPQQPTASHTQIKTGMQPYHKLHMQTIQIFKLATTKTTYQSVVALLPVPTKNVKDTH